MKVTQKVRKILNNYESDNPGTKASMARMLMHGRLAGTGKMVILPVDQGFEHGPGRSFGIINSQSNPVVAPMQRRLVPWKRARTHLQARSL